MDRPEMPESTKMLQIADLSQKIGEFLEWLPSIGVHLAVYDGNGTMYPQSRSIQSLLALHFDIDLDKVEQEKRALLDWIRDQQTEGANP